MQRLYSNILYITPEPWVSTSQYNNNLIYSIKVCLMYSYKDDIKHNASMFAALRKKCALKNAPKRLFLCSAL